MKNKFLLLGIKNCAPPVSMEKRERMISDFERKTGLPTVIYNADYLSVRVVSKTVVSRKKRNRNL